LYNYDTNTNQYSIINIVLLYYPKLVT